MDKIHSNGHEALWGLFSIYWQDDISQYDNHFIRLKSNYKMTQSYF